MKPGVVSGVWLLLMCGARGYAERETETSHLGRSEYFTTSDGVKLHCLDAGHGAPILFVPGWTLPAEIWAPQITELSSTFRTIALDPRSQGRSDVAAEGHYHSRRAADIHDLIDHLQLENVCLVGWSLACAEVLTYVAQFGTNRLASLVLVDGWLWIRGPEEGAEYLSSLKKMQKDRRAYADRFARGLFKQSKPDDYIRQLVDAHLKTPTAVATTLIANAVFGDEADLRPTLEKIDRPLLYTITPGDNLRAQSQALKAKIPAARVEVFAQSGHALFVDAPDRFNAVLREFACAANDRVGRRD